ncbi:CBS domain-containing protein [Streptomyces sp. NBC_00306]|uniref:CBS domain-containing protein n=1 Tax=Streptomyces sp. NBC_00306 TaxID=2975708 RepID=UPI002E2DE54C|nr:CBS domain-containing protein [Streptomyces sp. NBC_00306]
MTQKVREIMTGPPVTVGALTAVSEVAHRMRDADIGAVLVTDGDRLRGLVTDRDLVVRVMAEGRNPDDTTAQEACSDEPVTVAAEDDVLRAVQLMRKHSLRRLPVLDGGKPVGIIALGDLAIERDPTSALGDISSTPPND